MTSSPTPPVNLDAPIVAQVRAMGLSYDAWVHRSLRRGSLGQDGSLRLFRSDALERMTHIPWWLVPLVWLPLVAVLWVLAAAWQGLGPSGVAWLALAGFLGWTLIEYLLHRFFFHWKPQGALGRQIHFMAHGVHHLDPWDATRLVCPPLGALMLATPIFGLLWLALPLGSTLALMGGLLIGYVLYDMTHYHVHHGTCRTRWGKFLKAYHLAHHHKHHERMFGVSSPLWDAVFRTGRPRA